MIQQERTGREKSIFSDILLEAKRVSIASSLIHCISPKLSGVNGSALSSLKPGPMMEWIRNMVPVLHSEINGMVLVCYG
ncbi:MAG: hypothetical protein ACP5NO_05480 [Thermoplasmata archaeon]